MIYPPLDGLLERKLAMPRVNFNLDPDVQAEMVRVIPPRKRSRVVNEALRREFLRRRRELAMDRLKEIRQKTGTFSGREIVEAVRKDRTRRA
jgi:Arc/MetJ family transcription regulator